MASWPTDARLVALLSHRPARVAGGMIRVREPIQPSASWRVSTNPLGTLEILPPEVMNMTLMVLDAQSLAKLSQTCLRARDIVNNLPAYQAVRKHAGRMLSVLVKTRLAYGWTIYYLYEALRSQNCTSCGAFAPFFLIITCQRCCYTCLWKNEALWVTKQSYAEEAFGLNAADIAYSLPVMLSIPGNYHVKCAVARQQPLRLVNVGAAKRHATALGRFQEGNMPAVTRTGPMSTRDNFYIWNLRRAPHTRQAVAHRLRHPHLHLSSDLYCGMASIEMPTVSANGKADHGHWCLGCEHLCSVRVALLSNVRLRPYDDDPRNINHTLRHMQDISRSRADFVDHVKRCPGAQDLLRLAGQPYDSRVLNEMLLALSTIPSQSTSQSS